MTANKQQHSVPSSYLLAWVDPNTPEGHKPYVHVFNRLGGGHKRKSPYKIFKKPDLYTIQSGDHRDLSIEQHLSKLERGFVRVRGLIEACGEGDMRTAVDLYGFVAAMLARTPHKIDQMTAQWASIAKKARTIRINPNVPPIPRMHPREPGMTIDQVQKMADDPMGTWFPHSLNGYIRALTTLFGCDVLINMSPYPFVTSDTPAVVTFSDAAQPPAGRRFVRRGLGSAGCEITMPVSPTHALMFRHKPPGFQDWIQIDWTGVLDINFRTITRAQQTIISDREELFFVQSILDRVAKVDSESPRP